MNTEPILCDGDDLASVLADIRASGGVVTDLHTGVGANSGYKICFYGSGPDKAGAGSSRTPLGQLTAATPTNFERGDTPDDGSSSKDKQQASENHTGKVATVRGLLLQDEGRARYAMTRKVSGVCAEPSALTQFPHQCETPANPAAPEAVKGAVAPRDQFNDPKSPCYGPALWRLPKENGRLESAETARCGKSTPGAEKSRMGAHPKANPASAEPSEQEEAGGRTQHLSIATRLAALQEKFSAAGKIKRRQPKEARLPYSDA